ncbi:uncharacterized protein LOC132172645 isoform X2 [Corylus avellana]|uniref:uncharacterized protein LOC132172645 isoform X2 n=1 Tax=Corylus avellana TaxID=13451 RepID=UPI00286A3FAB|nr:uncharacterized protein LOC132172645 isoform X2 [Corylus avellana]
MLTAKVPWFAGWMQKDLLLRNPLSRRKTDCKHQLYYKDSIFRGQSTNGKTVTSALLLSTMKSKLCKASELTNLEMEYMWLVEKNDHCVPILKTIDIGEESFAVMKNFVCSLSDLLWEENNLPTAHLLSIM